MQTRPQFGRSSTQVFTPVSNAAASHARTHRQQRRSSALFCIPVSNAAACHARNHQQHRHSLTPQVRLQLPRNRFVRLTCAPQRQRQFAGKQQWRQRWRKATRRIAVLQQRRQRWRQEPPRSAARCSSRCTVRSATIGRSGRNTKMFEDTLPTFTGCCSGCVDCWPII